MLSLVLEYRAEAQSIAAWMICLAALVWGGGPEKAIALTWLVLFKGLDTVYRAIWGAQFSHNNLEILSAINDFMALVAFVVIALNANRLYALWIAAFQVLAMLAHVVRELVDQVSAIAYTILAFAPGYFQLGLMAGGLILHARRKRLHGAYRDWRLGNHAAGWQLFLSRFEFRA